METILVARTQRRDLTVIKNLFPHSSYSFLHSIYRSKDFNVNFNFIKKSNKKFKCLLLEWGGVPREVEERLFLFLSLPVKRFECQ